MRSIDEIKAEYIDCLNCKRAFDCLSISSECPKPLNIEHYHFEYLRAITDGILLDELETMCEAWRDGRCVALPCKVGDILYESLDDPFSDTGMVTAIKVNILTDMGVYEIEDIGTQAFTREAALQEGE